MQCPWCQHENSAGQKFCGECGARLVSACPDCGTSNPPGQKFCGACGEPLAQPAPAKQFAPETYTPKHLAEKVITSKAALEGERKQVTVLFADLKASMELLADRDPEEARKLLDPVLERMIEAVHRYEGTVNQVMGDGVMALFGAPLAHEDHAVRAGYAALRMKDTLATLAEELELRLSVRVQVRIGLNSGEVVVRTIGSDRRTDYSAVGQTTHLAHRMEQLATPGSILVTEAFTLLTEEHLRFKRLGPVSVKGLPEPTDVFELVGAEPTRTRFQAAASRGLTRFVGRQGELQLLYKALERAERHSGQVVAVIGEPGVGKSRLFHELVRSSRTRDWLVLETGSVSHSQMTAWMPVRDLLRTYFQIEDRAAAADIRDQVTARLTALDPSLRDVLGAVLWLLDVAVEDPAWEGLGPEQRRQSALDGVRRILVCQSRARPILLVFEDLHWCDSETQALLDSLVESLPALRLLLLVNYRPEYIHGWGSKGCYAQLRLETLPDETASELLEAVLGPDSTVHPLKPLLAVRAAGNPFFLEECVRTLVETKALAGERGAYRLIRPLDAIQVPATVHAVLAARIDRLPPAQKALLQSAAVIGKDVPFALLQAIADLSEPSLRRAITQLQAGEFLYQTQLFPDLEYTFKHALTHEVAYGSLLHERRRALNARLVRSIETLHAHRLAENVERLAHYALRAEMWPEALRYSRESATRAAARAAHREAVSFLQQALTVLQNLPETPDAMKQAIDVRFGLRASLTPLGEHGRISDYLREAESLAVTLGDQGRLGRASAYMSSYRWMMGTYDLAIESGRRALNLAQSLQDFALEVAARTYLGQVYHYLGNYRDASELFQQNVEEMVGDLNRERFELPTHASVHSRTWLVWCLAELGRFAEGITRGVEGIKIAESVDHPLSLTVACSGLGFLYVHKGDFSEAICVLERGLDLSQTWNVRFFLPRIASALGSAYALTGRVAEALPLLERAAEENLIMGRQGGHSHWMTRLSEGYLLAGRSDQATELAQRCLDIARGYKERGHEAWALRLLGEIFSQSDSADTVKARDCYRQASALAAELWMRPLLARCDLGLGMLHRQIGQYAEARAHLVNAAALFDEMRMDFWWRKSQAELAELD